MNEPPSATIHRIVSAFAAALSNLGVKADPLHIERWSVLVHEAMAGRARLFHDSEHIFDVVAGTDGPGDALEVLSILFHDVVYVQVDGAWDERVAQLLNGAVLAESGTYRVGALDAVSDPVAFAVMQVFGLSPGGDLSPFTGLNEFASALVAARQLAGLLPLSAVIAIAACIEATIPFRGEDAGGQGSYDRLAARLRQLDGHPLDEEGVIGSVRRAVRVANSDVGNFAASDPAAFLEKTWKLLPESNPALHLTTAYTVRQYRLALGKMEGFLGTLSPARVFHQWGGVPAPGVYAGLLERATMNLNIAVRYLRVKLYAACVLEALAELTGGDAPLELFAGAIPRAGVEVKRIDQHLPAELPASIRDAEIDVDPALLSLFVHGRASDSSFDLRASPLAAFLYRWLGEARMSAVAISVKDYAKGRLTALAFLGAQPPAAMAAMAHAAAQVAITRTAALEALALQLKSRTT